MARIRSIKPEFWTDPDVVALPMAARLFFIGCWNHADDYGVLKDDPSRLKLQILPGDDVDPYELVDMLVASNHLLRRVASDGTPVLVIRTFCDHQKIDKRSTGRWGHPDEFTIPTTPPAPQPSPTMSAESPPIPTIPDPGIGFGRERNGGEGRGVPPTPAEHVDVIPPPVPPAAAPLKGRLSEPRSFIEIIEPSGPVAIRREATAILDEANRLAPDARVTPSECRKLKPAIEEALAEGYVPAEIASAVASSPFRTPAGVMGELRKRKQPSTFREPRSVGDRGLTPAAEWLEMQQQ